MDKRHLGMLFLILLLLSFSLVACDDEDDEDDGSTANVISEVSEIRYHAQIGGHCETIRIFPPRVALDSEEIALLTVYLYEGPDDLPPESKADLAVAKQKLSQASIVLATSRGVFRGKIGNLIDDLGGIGVYFGVDVRQAARRLMVEVIEDLRWERFVPGGRSWEGKWEPAVPPAEILEAVRQAEKGRGTLYYSHKGNMVELWDEACLPRKTPTPTPGPTPTFLDLDYGESLDVMAPTPTPDWFSVSATPYVGGGGGMVSLTFYLRPGQGDPCTKVTFHLPVDAQGRPDLTQPFEISFFKGYLRYQVNLPPGSIAALDEAFPKQSPTAFQSMLAQAVSTPGAARMYFVNEWMSIEGSDRPLTDSLNPKGPLVQALYRLWAYRMGRTNWWQAQGVAWSAPDCGPRPTPTPTPPLVGQAATATPTPYEVAGVMTTPTPAVGGAPTPVPVAQATPTPQPTPTRPPVCGTASDCTERSDLGRAAFDSLNQLRQENGLPPLRWNNALYRAALEQARHMAATGQVTHQDCNGQYADSRVVKHGYIFRTVVENVGDSPPSTQIVILWQNSSGHLQNMLNTDIVDGAVAFCCVGGRCYVVFVGGSPP